MRLIDGDALMEIYEDRFEKISIRYGFNSECGVLSGAMKLLAEQQTIEPEQHWIPLSETTDLPEYEVMACNKYGELMFGFLSGADGRYECESDEELMYDVVAWMKKPKPYKENKHE